MNTQTNQANPGQAGRGQLVTERQSRQVTPPSGWRGRNNHLERHREARSHRTGSASPRLPRFVQDLLNVPPRAGTGVHQWLFRVARHLHAHMPAHEIIGLLGQRVAGCGRLVSQKEITDAVQNSVGYTWPMSAAGRQPTAVIDRRYSGLGAAPPALAGTAGPRSELNVEARRLITRCGGGLADLWELSEPRLENDGVHAEAIIDRLFPGNPLLCCGWSSRKFDTRPREDWRGELAGMALIVPSPMTSVLGQTRDGRVSRHTLANTGARRFLVCEFDSGTVDEQAALLLHLATLAPLVCAVHSGGKSLHGWFLVDGKREFTVLHFFRYAVSLGADPATWTRSQFVRMPDGTRDDGKRQPVYFLNYGPLGK